MREKLLLALREAARHDALPDIATVAREAGVTVAEVRAHLGPPENFAALLSYQQAPAAAPVNETRERIIASAMHIFARKGFQRASLDEVAADAGMTKGAIYWHFKSKNDLFFALLDQHFQRSTGPLMGDFEDLLQKGSDPFSILTTLFQSSVKRCTDDPEWARLYLECLSLSRDDDVRRRLSDFYDRAWALTADFTREMQARGVSAPVDAGVAAVFWGALFDGLMLAWLVKGEQLDLERLLPSLLRMLWQGFAPAAEKTESPHPGEKEK